MANELGDAVLELEVDLGGWNSKIQSAEDAANSFATNAEQAGTRAEQGLEKAERGAESLGQKLVDVAKIAAGFTIGTALTELPSMFGGAVGLIDAAAVSTGTLQARLGLTADEAAEMGSIARDVFANNFGQSLDEVTSKLALVQSALDLPTEDVQGITEDIFRLEDAFGDLGAEAPILVENVRTMRAAFPDKTEAEILDLIAASFQAGTGSSGDLLDTLQEYPTLFADLGLNANDMFQILDAGMEGGARNTDVLADAIKEFGIRVKTAGDTGQKAISEMFPEEEAERLIDAFAEGGEAGREAFFTVMEALNEVQDPQERYNRAVELFGTKAEDLGPVLDAMGPAWEEIASGSRDAGDATASLDSQYAGLGAKIERLKRQFQVFAMEALGPYGKHLGEAIDMGVSFGASIIQMAPGLATIIPLIWAKAAAWGAAGAAMILANLPLIAIVATIGLVVAGIVLLVQHWDTVVQKVPALGVAVDAVKMAFQAFIDWITGTLVPALTGFADSAMAAFQSIVDFIQTNWPLIETIITPVLEQVKLIVQTTWDAIKIYIEMVLGVIQGVIKTIMGLITGDWEMAWEGIKQIGQSIWDGISGLVELGINYVKDTISNVLNNIIAPLWETVWGSIRDTAQEIWDTITGALDKFVSGAQSKWEGFKNTLSDVADQIKQKLLSVGDWFSNLGDRIASAIQTALGWVQSLIDKINSIPSPSDIGGGFMNVVGKINPFAEGTQDYPGGWAVVGEEGPELVHLPKHSQIFPNNESRNMFKRGMGRETGVDGFGGPMVSVNFLGETKFVAVDESTARKSASNFAWGSMAALRARGLA